MNIEFFMGPLRPPKGVAFSAGSSGRASLPVSRRTGRPGKKTSPPSGRAAKCRPSVFRAGPVVPARSPACPPRGFCWANPGRGRAVCPSFPARLSLHPVARSVGPLPPFSAVVSPVLGPARRCSYVTGDLNPFSGSHSLATKSGSGIRKSGKWRETRPLRVFKQGEVRGSDSRLAHAKRKDEPEI